METGRGGDRGLVGGIDASAHILSLEIMDKRIFEHTFRKVKVKVKVRYLLQRCLHESDSRPAALYNLGSGS